MAGWTSSCQQVAGRQSAVALVVVQWFVQYLWEEETPRLHLGVRRWADLLKQKEHCYFIHTENNCTTAATSPETHLNNVNGEQESKLIRALFHLIGYHAS